MKVQRVVHIAATCTLAFLMLGSGCCTKHIDTSTIENHVMFVNSEGLPVKTHPHRAAMQPNEFASKLATMSSAAVQSVKSGHASNILVFVHGGLNTLEDGMKRASDYAPKMTNEGVYPIFVSWDSGLFSSWGEHLVSLRQGRYWDTFGPILIPAVILKDLGRAITRAPLTFCFQLCTDARALRENWSREYPSAAAINDLMANNSLGGLKANALISSSPCVCKLAKTLGGLPPQLITGSLLPDMFGVGAWGAMRRRAYMMFHVDRENRVADDVKAGVFTGKDLPEGAMTAFAKMLVDLQSRCSNATITLVGHSMGTIVASRLLAEHGSALRIDNVVFMAAACTAGDVFQDVVPYLKSHTNCCFYNLMLHPRCEASEVMAWGVLGTGSLLEQIDTVYGDPMTTDERVIGKWENAMIAALSVDPEVRSRVSFKTFPYGDDNTPQKHGDFDNKGAFWRPEWWKPSE